MTARATSCGCPARRIGILAMWAAPSAESSRAAVRAVYVEPGSTTALARIPFGRLVATQRV